MKIVSHKQLRVDEDLKQICRLIIAENKTDDQWSKIESDDMFQTGPYCGGYSGIEQEFWFSYYDSEKKEWWLGFNIIDAKRIEAGELQYLDLIEPN